MRQKKPENNGGFARRLRTAIGDQSVNAFAKKVGVAESLVRRYLRGDALPGLEILVDLAKTTNVSVEWLATGEGELSRSSALKSEAVPVSTRPEVRASAGGGAPVYSEETAELCLPAAWLRGLGVRATDVEVLTVIGDSMEPTLRDGDAVVLDKREGGRVGRDAIYVITLEGEVMVKRLQRRPAGEIRILSDNPAYPAMEIGPESARDLVIHGRVIGALKRM